ncbi:MAG: TonB-dependent receptor, partial [Gammaproteobacteria bacterium]
FFQIRGIGERSQYEGAPNPSVGFIVDDIDFSGVGGIATLFDIDRIEVLRGPQGTRYGANALAGLIYLRSTDPSHDYSAKAQLLMGSDGARGAGLAVGNGLTETAAFRASFYQYQSNGFRENAFLGRDDTNERDEAALRFKLRWQPTERLTVDWTQMYVDLDNGYDAWAIDNSLTTQSDKPGRDEQTSHATAIRVTWDGSKDWQLTSITTHARSDIFYSFDGDWGNPAFWGANGPYDFTSATQRDRSTWSQEIRVVSTPEGALWDGKADWLFGVYALRLEEDNDQTDMFNGSVYTQLASQYDATNLAIFGQLDFALSAADTLSVGVRVERRDAEYQDTETPRLTPSETMVGGHLTWSHLLDKHHSAYLTVARGYKAGGFNLGAQIPDDRRQFDAEHLWNIEGGLRGYWLSGKLRAQISAFYMARKDQQVKTSFQDNPNDPLSFTFYTDNAAQGQNYGLEFESHWRINDHWQVTGNLGLLRTNIEDYVVGTRQLDGREQAYAPKYNFAVGVRYEQGNGWYAQTDVTGQDGYYYSDSHDHRAKPYVLTNVKLGYTQDWWEIYLWGRNIFDKKYTVRGFFFANEPPDWIDKLYTQQGDPAQWGVTFRVVY